MRRRYSEVCLSIVAAGLLAAGAKSASAAETFLCPDGRMLKIDSSNRAALADDPCVKAWFEGTGPKGQPVARTPEAVAEPASPLKRAEPSMVRVQRYTSRRRLNVD